MSCAPRTSAPRCSSCRPPRTPRRTAASPTPSACCSGTTRRSSRGGDARSELWFYYHLGRIIRREARRLDRPARPPAARPDLGLPDRGDASPSRAPRRCCAEINGCDADGKPLSAYTELKDDGSTACGCWIYCGVYADGVNQAARRKPGREQSWVAPEWGWAWPANRRILYNRASADPDGRPWSERKAYVWWDAEQQKWTGHDVPDFEADKRPDYRPPEDAPAEEALAGDRPVHHAGRRQGLAVRAGRPHRRAAPDALRAAGVAVRQRRSTASSATPPASSPGRKDNPLPPTGGSDVFPYVFTTYRLTEHHTAGGMSRWLPYLSELQPEMFCEISPELAARAGLEHMGWATVITARTAIEARVLVTDRMVPLTVQGRVVHQIGLPYHWGPNGLVHGDAANELAAVALDPNVHIQESKAATCDIQPGRRPRGQSYSPTWRDTAAAPASRTTRPDELPGHTGRPTVSPAVAGPVGTDHYGVGMDCRVNGVAVHYVEYGIGVPLVALHGAGVDHREIEAAVEAIVPGTGYRRIYPDLPGMGRSRADGLTCNDDVVKLLGEFIGDVAGGPAMLLGHSYGAYLARGVAAQRPDVVLGLALLCPVAERSRNVPDHDVVRQDAEAYDELEPEQRVGFDEYFVVRTPATARRYRDHVVPGTTLVDETALERIFAGWTVDVGSGTFAAPTLIAAGAATRSSGTPTP